MLCRNATGGLEEPSHANAKKDLSRLPEGLQHEYNNKVVLGS